MKTFQLLVLAASLGVTSPAWADHPQILATTAQRGAITRKLEDVAWAKSGLNLLKERIDLLVQKTVADPQFVTSRLMMNWETHYTTTLVEKSRTLGGEGHAPVPTPRFEGARNWATDYALPTNFGDWKPYNDTGGQVYLLNKKTNAMEWVAPGVTGHNIRNANQQILGYAQDAAFLYWVTNDEKYARFASDILWPYVQGFSYTTPPRFVSPDSKAATIIGPTAFEVIHEGVVPPVALAYDFLEPYLAGHGRDPMVFQVCLRRWADRIIDGGGREGNWNLIQAGFIAYAGLALEPNGFYPDGKGREYYAHVVLSADLPAQKGIVRVLKEGFDPVTSLWPEAAGYGFGSTAGIIDEATLLANTPEGASVLKSPAMVQGLLNQIEILHPNGRSTGVVVDGTSIYDPYKDPKRAMSVERAEPSSQAAALSPDVSLAEASFSYGKPAANQDRTLALIRTGAKSGFYFDVFRSKAEDATGEFHDYLYHNMGDGLVLSQAGDKALTLAPTATLAKQSGVLKGYTYLKNERSVAFDSDIHATFDFKLPDGTQPTMNLWMPGQAGRTFFAVETPPNRAARSILPPEYALRPMQALVVRQRGEAWHRPFVAVYEPFLSGEDTIRNVRAAPIEGEPSNLVSTVVEGIGYLVRLFQDVVPSRPRQCEGATFQGNFAVTLERGGRVEELYLGNGSQLTLGGISLRSADARPLSASLRRGGARWTYSSDREVVIDAGGGAKQYPAAMNARL